MKSLSNFTKDTLLYAMGVIFQRLTFLLLIPIYTRALNTDQYGVYETANVISQTLIVFFDLGISRAILRYCTLGHDKKEIEQILKTAIALSLLVSVIFLISSLFFAPLISDQLLKNHDYTVLVMGIVLWTMGIALNQIQFAYFRARQEAFQYLLVSVLQAFMIGALNIIFVNYMNLDVKGIILGNLISVWVLGFYTIKNIFSQKITISIYWARKIVKFGTPLILSMLGLFILNSADRYILAYYGSMTEVGIYGLGYKVGLLVSIAIITPFQLAWPNFVFEQEESQNTARYHHYERILTVLLVLICILSLLVIMFAKEIITMIGTEKFAEASLVIPYVVLAYIFYAIYYYYGAFYLLKEKTAHLSIITLSMAIVNILLNLAWVPKFGWRGAAWSTVITVCGTALVVAVYGRKIFPLNIQYSKTIFLLILTGVAGGGFTLIHNSGLDDSLWIRLLIIVSFVAILFIFKVLDFVEIKNSFLSLSERQTINATREG